MHPFGDVGLEAFDMLNEFPELAGGNTGANNGGGAGLLTPASNVTGSVLVNNGAGGKGSKFLNGHHQRELVHITDFCPEWAWSDVSVLLHSAST